MINVKCKVRIFRCILQPRRHIFVPIVRVFLNFLPNFGRRNVNLHGIGDIDFGFWILDFGFDFSFLPPLTSQINNSLPNFVRHVRETDFVIGTRDDDDIDERQNFFPFAPRRNIQPTNPRPSRKKSACPAIHFSNRVKVSTVIRTFAAASSSILETLICASSFVARRKHRKTVKRRSRFFVLFMRRVKSRNKNEFVELENLPINRAQSSNVRCEAGQTSRRKMQFVSFFQKFAEMVAHFEQNFLGTIRVFDKKPVIAELIVDGKFMPAIFEIEPHFDHAVRDKFGNFRAFQILRHGRQNHRKKRLRAYRQNAVSRRSFAYRINL